MRRILLACLLVTALEMPIGHSMDGLIMRYSVYWCPEYYEGPSLMIERQVVTAKGVVLGGKPTQEWFPLPKPETEPAPTAPEPAP